MRRSWQNLVLMVFTTLRFSTHKEKLLSTLSIHGEEYIQQSLNAGKGILLLAPHTGDFLLSAAYLAQNHSVSVIARLPNHPSTRNFMLELYQKFGFEVIERRGGLKRVITPGYPVRLVDFPMPVSELNIAPITANTGVVLVGVGENSVYWSSTDERGHRLRMRTESSPSIEDVLTYTNVDLHDVFIDAAVAEEGVRWSARE